MTGSPKFGVNTHTRGPLANREGYLTVAKSAERAGLGFITVNDHVVVPADVSSRYPYSESGEWGGAGTGECLEQLATLSFLAAATEKLELLTSVMVVPHRHPVLAAKTIATVDVLSNGRVLLGCGAGWMEEEFDLLDAPFQGRGKATDEYIKAFKVLWTEDRPVFKGEYVDFDNVLFTPKPKRVPPIWIGGESNPAMRRTVRVGDVWYPGTNNPARRLDTPERVAGGMAELRQMAEKAGRDPAEIGLALTIQWKVNWTEEKTVDGTARRMFTGTSDMMREDAAQLAALGVSHVALQFESTAIQETIDKIERFGREVARA